MIFDKYLNRNSKILISIISGCIWIYFRTTNCYNLIPRKKILPVILVGLWIYLNYIEPLVLPLGLLILYLGS
mgnify:CR=1 FL=1